MSKIINTVIPLNELRNLNRSFLVADIKTGIPCLFPCENTKLLESIPGPFTIFWPVKLLLFLFSMDNVKRIERERTKTVQGKNKGFI